VIAISDPVAVGLVGVLNAITVGIVGVVTLIIKNRLDKLAKVGEATHMLVNSAMGAQLKLHADTARAKSDITGQPADIAVANLAEKMLAEHVAKQAALDKHEEDSNRKEGT
jgi:hypothetical protein